MTECERRSSLEKAGWGWVHHFVKHSTVSRTLIRGAQDELAKAVCFNWL